jgi:predicted aldo/keto reductase-like oxidoreductase
MIMLYRKLGRTGVDVGVIGLGLEHLEHAPKETVVSIVREAIDNGVNYMDLFMGSSGIRDNVGIAIKGRRDKVMIAGHLGAAMKDGQYLRTRDKVVCEDFFNDLLKRLNTTYIDVLMLHFIDEMDDYERVFSPHGVIELALELKQQGKARFIGLSSHKVPVALKAVNSGYIDVLMFPVNPMFDSLPGNVLWDDESTDKLEQEVETQTRKELYFACAAKDVAIVAMKPYAAGKLLNANTSPIPLTPIQCLSYVLSQPGVCCAVPGCKTPEELKATLAYINASNDEKDFTCINKARSQWRLEGNCMYCNHCLPCPSDINIAKVISLVDTAEHEITDVLKRQYNELKAKASHCIKCGVCAKRCPFDVDVVLKMERAETIFEA